MDKPIPEYPWWFEIVPGIRFTVARRPGLIRRTVYRILFGFKWVPRT